MGLLALTGLTFFNNFMLWLITLLYGLIASAFGVFMQLSSAELFDNEFITSFTDRIYLILGIVALFLLSYTFLQAIINPEEGTKNGGQIVKRLVISLVVVALVPTLFDVLYQVQNAVLTENTIPKLFFTDDTTSANQSFTDIDNDLLLQYTDTSGEYQYLCSGCINSSGKVGGSAGDFIKNCVTATTPSACANGVHQFGSEEQATSMQIKVPGNQLSYLLFSSFIYPLDENQEEFNFDPSAGWDIFSENTTFANVENLIVLTGDFSYASMFIDEIEDGNMEFDWLFALIAGGFLCYMIVSFCFDLGIRVVKLLFLQLVAPVPIFMSVYPKNADLLSNWLKMTLTTFLEVFVRVFCITGAIYIINIVSAATIASIGLIGNAFVILGVVAFMKELPKLFGEITGIKGSGMSLGIKDKLKAGGVFAGFDFAKNAALRGYAIARSEIAGHKQAVNNFNKTKGNALQKIGSAIAGYGSATSKSLWNTRKSSSFSDINKGAATANAHAGNNKKIRERTLSRYTADYQEYDEKGNALLTNSQLKAKGRMADFKDDVKTWFGVEQDLKSLEAEEEKNQKIIDLKNKITTGAKNISNHEAVQTYKGFQRFLNEDSKKMVIKKLNLSENEAKDFFENSNYKLKDFKTTLNRYDSEGYVEGKTRDINDNLFEDEIVEKLNLETGQMERKVVKTAQEKYREDYDKLQNQVYYLNKAVEDTILFSSAQGYSALLETLPEEVTSQLAGLAHSTNDIQGTMKEAQDMIKNNLAQYINNIKVDGESQIKNLKRYNNESDEEYLARQSKKLEELNDKIKSLKAKQTDEIMFGNLKDISDSTSNYSGKVMKPQINARKESLAARKSEKE